MDKQYPPVDILLVEDDEDDYTIVRDLLSDLCASGSKLHWVADYDLALEAIHSGKFDVCLLDYLLGSRNGMEFLKEVTGSDCRTPVIFLTGQGDYKLDLEAMKSGAADYLNKDQLSAILLERSIRYTIEVRQKNEELLKAKMLTERRLAEEALRESEERLRLAMEATSDGVWDWNIKTGEVFRSPSFFSMLGYRQEEFEGKFCEWRSLIHPDDTARVTNILSDYLNGKRETYEIEFRMLSNSGSIVWILSRGKVVAYDEEGKPARMVGTHTDITSRMQSEAALRESEARWQFAIEGAGDGLWDWNVQTGEVFFSRQWKVMLGFENHEIGTTVNDWDKRVHPWDKERVHADIRDHFDNRTPMYANEHRIQCKDGSYKWVLDRGKVISWSDDGKPLRMIGTNSDITERKLSEDLIRIRLSLLEFAASHSLEDLLRKALDEAGVLTNSPLGFCHFVESDQKTLSLQTWSTPTMEFCKAKAEGRHRNLDQAGLWAECVHKKKPVIHNDCSALQHSKGLPEGHVLVTRELVVPIVRKESIVAILGIGNKPFDYVDKDVEVVSHLADVVWPIIDHKRAEDGMRNSEELKRGILNSVPSHIAVLDRNGVIIEVNEPWVRFAAENSSRDNQSEHHTGLNVNYLQVCRNSAGECSEGAMDAHDGIVAVMEGSLPSFSLEYPCHSPKVQRWFMMTVTPLGTRDGEVVISHTNITERKKVENALRESETYIRAVMDNLPIGVAVNSVDPTVDFTYMNNNFPKFYRTTKEALAAQDAFWSSVYEDPVFREEIKKRVLDDCASGDPERMHWEDVPITRNGQKTTFISACNTLVPGKQLMISSVWDVTSRKRAEEEKEKLQAQLLQAQKMESVGRLAGGVAHDFNNMLGVIIGHAEMALDETNHEDSRYLDLKEIHKAARRSADLTRQLLAFARKQTISPKVLDLNDTVSSMINMLQRLIGEDIDLAWVPGNYLWSVKIDPSQVDQLLANLAVNARDAITGVGKITIETANVVCDDSNCLSHQEFAPGEYVLLAVSDNGIGIGKDILDHIFEPFFTTKEVGKGTGLGLATIYGIVKQNQGFIHVYSEPGRGTTFRIYLPRFQEESIEKSTETSASMPPVGKETILIVEDEEAIMNLSKTILLRLGYTVLTANTPAKAIQTVAQYPGDIQLLITDVVMPEMNGRELAEQLSSLKAGLKCLFMSGYTSDTIAHHGILDEGVHFIQKPFTVKGIAEKVRETLDS